MQKIVSVRSFVFAVGLLWSCSAVAEPPAFLIEPEFEAALSGSADATRGTENASTSTGRFELDAGLYLGRTLPELFPGAPWPMPEAGLGVSVDGMVTGGTCETCEAEKTLELIGSAEVRARALWVDAWYRETYQRPVSFRDTYWRNEAGTIRRAVGFELPALVPVRSDVEGEEYEGGALPFSWERRELFQASLGDYFTPDLRLGDEYEARSAMGWGIVYTEDTAIRFEMMGIAFGTYVVPDARRAEHLDLVPIYRTPSDDAFGVSELHISILDMRFSRREIGITRFQLGGANYLRPASHGSIVSNDGQTSFSFDYAIAVGQAVSRDFVPGWESFGERMPRLNRIGWNVELQRFGRIDPTGLAADVGHELSGDIAFRPIEAFTLSGRAAAIVAERAIISELRAPDAPLVAEVGDTFVMGRLETLAEWDFHEMLSLRANLWLERSDRADVTVRSSLQRGIIPLDTNFGGWLGVNFHPF